MLFMKHKLVLRLLSSDLYQLSKSTNRGNLFTTFWWTVILRFFGAHSANSKRSEYLCELLLLTARSLRHFPFQLSKSKQFDCNSKAEQFFKEGLPEIAHFEDVFRSLCAIHSLINLTSRLISSLNNIFCCSGHLFTLLYFATNPYLACTRTRIIQILVESNRIIKYRP